MPDSFAKRMLKSIPGTRNLGIRLRGHFVPHGHFYSPIPDFDDVAKRAEGLFSRDIDSIPGVDLRTDDQKALLEKYAPYGAEFPFPDTPQDRYRYYVKNIFFERGDGLGLYCALRHFKPKRVVEVGSGFSSALMLDTNDLFLDGAARFTFVEPYPDRLNPLLRPTDRDRATLLQSYVQDVPPSTFEQLEAGDILFIDSSHVSKIGSDLNHLMFNVLPSLKPGVLVHFHDIFWPFEYPRNWVLEQRRAWNEPYLLRAFLMYNGEFQIVFFNDYLACRFPDLLKQYLPGMAQHPGGSIWLTRK